MSLAFLSPGPDAPARSPMAPGAETAGATFEQRDGWEVATRLRADPALEEVPILAMTAYDVSAAIRAALHAGRSAGRPAGGRRHGV